MTALVTNSPDDASSSGAQSHEVPLQRLEHALASRTASTPLSVWRWAVMQRMVAVRDLLVTESEQPPDWLAASRSRALRERNLLLGRMSGLRFRMMGDPDVDRVGYELQRLVGDVRHFLQKLNDLAYEEVEGEVGGSE